MGIDSVDRERLEEEEAKLLEQTRNRRQLLKLAGASVVGAAGMAALTAVPASAATGGNFVLGQANSADAQTSLQYNGSSGSIAGFAVSNTTANSSGGHGISASGTGGGVDIKLVGTGRFGQNSVSGVSSAAPTFSPAFGEIIRGTGHELWVSTATSGGQAAWRRINSVRFDAADNSGNGFVPVRIIDTRDGTGGHTGALNPNTVYTLGPFTGTKGIPGNAVGVVGNFTIGSTGANFTGAGFAAVFPGAATWPGTSNINYPAGVPAMANAAVVGFGTGANAGKLSFYIGGGAPATHVVFDVFGYIQ
jgi:hypothetical protein